jgi:hypothetical protein
VAPCLLRRRPARPNLLLLRWSDAEGSPFLGGGDDRERESKVDIPARTDLNDSIKVDQFEIIQIPTNWAHEGAVISVDQLRDRYDSVPIHGRPADPGGLASAIRSQVAASDRRARRPRRR